MRQSGWLSACVNLINSRMLILVKKLSQEHTHSIGNWRLKFRSMLQNFANRIYQNTL
jgi:hypothetical protein